MTPELAALLGAAKARWFTMTPAKRCAALAAQRQSYVLGEVGIGSDRDEAAYRTALDAGDTETLARLNRETDERVAMAQKHLDERE